MEDAPQSLTPVSEKRNARALLLGVASLCMGVAAVVG
jgi:hypothetical protein